MSELDDLLSELDDSLTGMSGTQVSQWISEKLPSDQGKGRPIDNGPKNDSEMLAFLLEEDLEVKNNKEIMKTLQIIQQNTKNLKFSTMKELRMTYAYLSGYEIKNKEVLKWKKKGLRHAIIASLSRLTPRTCQDCKGPPFFMTPGNEPEVVCVRCKMMACPVCINKELITHKRIKYLCEPCEADISDDVALEANYYQLPTIEEDVFNEENEEKEQAHEDTFISETKSTAAHSGININPLSQIPTTTSILQPHTLETKICPLFRSGICKHGLSGRNCQFYHPRICKKLFRYGPNKPDGCQGKYSGCQNFHPRLCLKHLEGECANIICPFGIHLKCNRRKNKTMNKEKEFSRINNIDQNTTDIPQHGTEDSGATPQNQTLAPQLYSELVEAMRNLRQVQETQGKMLESLIKEESATKFTIFASLFD